MNIARLPQGNCKIFRQVSWSGLVCNERTRSACASAKRPRYGAIRLPTRSASKWQATPARIALPSLPVHLGKMLAFFVTLSCTKFVDGIYRVLALLTFACEIRSPSTVDNTES